MKIWLQAAAACCTACVLAPPAWADLVIDELTIHSAALYSGPAGALSQISDWSLASGLPPVAAVASVRLADSLAASARLTPDGFFMSKSRSENDFFPPAGTNTAGAATRYELTVSANAANTPLLLDFNVFGSKVFGNAYYGDGRMKVETSVFISASRNGALANYIWGYGDGVVLDSTASTADRFSRVSSSVDSQGIGLPADHEFLGYLPMSFISAGSVDRDAFSGHLDFGLLQPGETFTLRYESRTYVQSEIRYAGKSSAELIDPFLLGGAPAPALELFGLVLPQAAPVPEPGRAGLLLAGCAGLWWAWRRRPVGLGRSNLP